MDRIYSEINAEDDHTDHTVKRRISSILKVPRTPLRDLGGGNELIQGCNIEKRQKNSRRVSFADKIRVFPSDLQTNVESDHAEETTEARHQEPLSQNEKPETLQFEITGMNTLLHAPIQTPLQQMECHDINTCQEWNKMNRTLLFSEENEMDMTAGHTVMITHDIGTYEETDKPRKIDFKSFSTELKMNKENTEIHEFNNPTKVNERCLSQQNTNIGNTRKIKFDDFLKSLQSSKPSPTPAAEVSFLPSEVLERKICSSERNVSFHMQGKSNTTTVFGGLDNKTAVTQYCLSNTETIAPPTCHASKQTRCGGVTLHCRDESMDRTVANTERVLPADLSSLTGAKQHQNLEREKTVSYDSCQLKPSSYPSGIQHTAMCINNNGEAGVAKKCGVRLICKDASLPSNQEISVENKASTNLNSIPYDEMAASEQKAVYGNKELQNLSIKPGSSTSSHLERKENTLLVSLPCDKSAVFSAKGIDLNRNYVAKTERRQVGCQLPLSQTVVAEMNGITAVNYKTNEKSGCSSNKVPPISADKTIMFAASEDMELTKPTAYLIDKSLKAAGFYQKPQEEIRSGKHNIIGRASDKTVVFSLGEDNEMDITKSCTVAVNHNFMQRCERHPQVLPLQPVGDKADGKIPIGSSKDKSVVFFCSDENEMEITRSHTVALNYDDIPQGSNIPIATHVPPDKTVMFTFSEDMEITRPVAYAIDKSLKSVTGSLDVPPQDTADGKRRITGTASDKTVVFSLGEDNEMEITKSCTVAVNHNFIQHCKSVPEVLPLQPVEKTIVYASQNDMDTTKPNTCIIDQSLENAVHKLDKEADWRTIESSKDETVMFFCNDENEMEITRSHTVALNHDDVPQGDSIPIATHVPPDKTVMFTFSEDMEITRPVAYAIDKSLKSVTGSLDEPAQDTTDGKRRITGTASDKTVVFSLGEDNEMEITKSCTVAVNHDFMQHCENVPELLPLQPDKTVAYTSHNDMDMTKPVIGIIDQSVENAAAQGVHKLDKEADWRTPIESTKDKTVVFFFSDENEMEISRSHTVTVNHDTIQHIGGAPQAQSLFPAERTYVLVRNSNMSVNKPTSFIPADKIMMVIPNNDKEITKPVGHVMDSSQKSKEKETDKVMLPELIKQETVAFLLHEDNEMEITKVAVNHDIQQMEEAPQELSIIPAEKTKVSGQNSNMATGFVPADKILMCMHSNNMEISKPLTDASLKNTSSKALAQEGTETKKAMLSGPVKGNAIIVKLHDNEMEVTKCHTIEVNHDIFSQCERRSLVQFNQDIDITGSHNDMKSMHGVTQDIDITKNHTANIYDPNCYIPKLKKQLLNSLKKPREKTTAFSDGETMEITRNHTTGIEFMNKNNCNNEHSSCSQAKSEFPPLVVPHEKELAVIKTDKHTPEKSLSSYNVKLPIPVNNVNKQNLLRIQENQLETQPSGINKLAEVASNDVHCSAENEYMLPVEMLVQNPKSCDETALNLNTERICMLVTETENLKDYPEKLSLIRHESTLTGETKSLPVAGTATKIEKAVLCELGHVTKDRQTNLDPPINNFCSEEDPVLLPKVPGINDCSKLINIGKTSETGLMSQNARPSLGGEPMMKPKELKEGFRIESSNYVSNELKSKTFTEGDPFHVPFNPMQKNNCQIKKLPLGIFPPKLPNKRKSTIANVEDTGERTKPQDSQNSLLIMKVSDKITQHLSPSHYIGEELLPPCIEEMDFSELLSCELLEKVCDVMDEKEITNNGHLKETCRQKRDRDQEGEELQNEKKLKVYEGWSDTTELKQPFPSTIVTNEETLEGKNAQDVMASNMERTHSSNGSSLDSTKADSDLSNQRNAEIETELLMDSICEQNLHEKLQEGVITVREFFTLLQVHVLIQKPRQSLLPPKYIANSSPAPEDLILSQYIDHPKLQMYNEDCQALSEIIEELKLCADNQDKLLVNVNKSLWEVMRTCSDEELKEFGAELNKMKSCFAKKSKTLAHRGKAKLYMKLVQNAQLQWEKLQSRLNKMDELFKEMDIYLVALEAETAKLEDLGLGVSDSVTDYESKLRQTEQELENYKAQEEALQRDQSNLRGQQQQRVSEISHLQEEAKSCQEQMEKYNFSEWVMKEWNDEQAVFTFLCDSVELTVTLGCPVAASAAVVTTKKLYRQIVGVNIESLLDEAKAPASSKLVQKLIFQFINDQSSWQEKYSTVTHLAQLLHDLSLVVSRCQLLGEEIEFLNRWGGKFSLLKTAVNDTKVKLLFSSSLAFAKFEVELSLSANYPTSPVVFTVQKYTGNLGQEEISEVLSGVPVGANYLTRMVNQIHHRLLQNPSTIHKQQK